MRASNQHRPYQGYPYVNPPVHDAPSIDAATASRWTNLPRRQVELPVQRTEPVVYNNYPHAADNSLPGIPVKADPDPEPVVYIDTPEAGASYVSTERRPSSADEKPEASTYRDKRKSTDEPVVYIDLPDSNGSDVASPQNEDPEEPEYVRETIFYNPFENRRIEMNKEETRRNSESDDESTVSSHSYRRPYPIRPSPSVRPSQLDLYGAGSSGASSSNAAGSTSRLPPLMGKETMVYGNQDDGAFPMSLIPASEFPEPPPAYAEIDLVRSPTVDPQEPVVDQPRREEPPRTQVILPTDPPVNATGAPSPERKTLTCHHCGTRVQTLVVRQNGTITHIVGVSFFLTCMLPCGVFVYCTDYLKMKNHFCPNCNKVIGSEPPLPCGNNILYDN